MPFCLPYSAYLLVDKANLDRLEAAPKSFRRRDKVDNSREPAMQTPLAKRLRFFRSEFKDNLRGR